MIKVVQAPKTQVVSVSEIKDHLRLNTNADDRFLEASIPTATQMIEDFIGRKMLFHTLLLQERVTQSGRVIDLPFSPLQSVEEVRLNKTKISSVSWNWDPEGYLFLPHQEGTVVSILYVAGYAENAYEVPAPLRHAVRMVVSDLYESRGHHPLDTGLWRAWVEPFKALRLR